MFITLIQENAHDGTKVSSTYDDVGLAIPEKEEFLEMAQGKRPFAFYIDIGTEEDPDVLGVTCFYETILALAMVLDPNGLYDKENDKGMAPSISDIFGITYDCRSGDIRFWRK